jgi:succinyl-CoA synthetase beta subunit
LDLLYREKGKPASCLIIGGYASWDLWSMSSPVQQLQSALHQIMATRGIQVVLVNILSSPAASQKVAEAIANYLLAQVGETPLSSMTEWRETPTGATSHSHQIRSSSTSILRQRSTSLVRLPQFVIRTFGGNLDLAKERSTAIPVHWTSSLDEAVAQAISLAKSRVKLS